MMKIGAGMKNKTIVTVVLIGFLVVLALGLGFRFITNSRNDSAATGTPTPAGLPENAPTNVWDALSQVTPVSYGTPLPEPETSPLDGTYAKYDTAPPQWWSCLRCADYRPAGGAWRLQFDRGVMRIYYEVTGWHSLASYTVSGDRLYLFNDPYCKDMTGEYKWSLEDGSLTLETVGDSCAFQLRERNLSAQTWEACTAGAGGEKPRGCEDPSSDASFVAAPRSDLTVSVHEGDVRKFSVKPEVYVHASGGGPAGDGIKLTYSEQSLLYGVGRVLWTDEDWVEVTTRGALTSMGVQFRGDYMIGWARVLFDGEEIWRGDTSRIWTYLRDHGGYIEVSGFEPGGHVLRVERLEVDSRPVVVSFFCFNQEGGVEE
jgi:hypothetical protein